MRILVIAEHDNKNLHSATLNTVSAALKIGTEIDVLIAGSGLTAIENNTKKISGIKSVLKADSPAFEHQLPEDVAPVIVKLAPSYTHILAPASAFGKNLMPRVAALLDVQQISDIIKVIDADTFDRPVYAGNAIATIRSKDSQKVITVRPTAFDAAPLESNEAPVQTIDASAPSGLSSFVGAELSKSERPELGSARIVISGGRGVGSKENFALIEKLADRLGAAVGASRAAVDAGYVPNDYQVGQTGKVVAPDLYIAIGISGAIQHLAGMKDSKVIVAINKDADAPIFGVADYGLVGDLFQIVAELESKL